MKREDALYAEVCRQCGVEELTDEDIERVALIIKGRLGELGDAGHVGVGKTVHVDADAS